MLSLLVSIALLAGEPMRPAAPEVWVRLERGRAEIVGEGPASVIDSLGAWRRIDGRGELRLDARGVASLRWNGRASLELVGPARCQFDCDAEGAPRATLTQLVSGHVEVRKGAFGLDLDGGWRADCSPGVLALDSRGSTGLSVERVVGEPLAFERVGLDPLHARRVVVAIGANALLAMNPVLDPRVAAQEARRERAALWPSFSWPWPAEEPWLDVVVPAPALGDFEGSPPSSSEPAPAALTATRELGASGSCEPVLAPACSPETDGVLGGWMERRATLFLDLLVSGWCVSASSDARSSAGSRIPPR